jgi:NDP-sugar pyrophosphorylase family protein
MKALILAGGLGTRLRPLTYSRPKVLLPIANRPHIEHVFDLLQRHSVSDVVLTTSYMAEAFAPTISEGAARGLDARVAYEQEALGTAGALKNAEGQLSDETFLAFNGDVLTDVDLDAVLAFHRDRGAEATIVLTPVEDPSAFGVVPTDADGRVLGFIEKPPREDAATNLINAGIYVLEPSVLRRIPAGEQWSAEHQLFPQLVKEEARIFALATEAYWLDMGTPEKYLQANLDALAGRFATSAVPAPGEDAVVIGEGAEVAADARISSACVGAGAVIESQASVTRSVVLPGAEIGSGAAISGSIVGERARVDSGARLVDETVADGDVIAA